MDYLWHCHRRRIISHDAEIGRISDNGVIFAGVFFCEEVMVEVVVLGQKIVFLHDMIFEIDGGGFFHEFKVFFKNGEDFLVCLIAVQVYLIDYAFLSHALNEGGRKHSCPASGVKDCYLVSKSFRIKQ